MNINSILRIILCGRFFDDIHSWGSPLELSILFNRYKRFSILQFSARKIPAVLETKITRKSNKSTLEPKRFKGWKGKR